MVVSCLAEMVPEVSIVEDMEYAVTTPVVASAVSAEEQPERIAEVMRRGIIRKMIDLTLRRIVDSLTII